MKVVGRETFSIVHEHAAAWAPASLSNLGPGFDILGVAIHKWGDCVEAIPSERPGITISYTNGSIWSGAPDAKRNTAGVAAERTCALLGYTEGIELVIDKHIAPGSGIGSSAASAVAAAWAVNCLFDTPLTKEELILPILEGESVASGSRHGDNAIPCLVGGMAIVSAVDPAVYRQIRLDERLRFSVILPSVQVLTRAAREMLPTAISFRDAIEHSSSLAMLIDSFKEGDWKTAGTLIMADKLVEPVRSRLVSCYEVVKRAALQAGAHGCALSGSGPAMFAISDNENDAELILDEMLQASEKAGIPAIGLVTTPDNRGVREVPINEIA